MLSANIYSHLQMHLINQNSKCSFSHKNWLKIYFLPKLLYLLVVRMYHRLVKAMFCISEIDSDLVENIFKNPQFCPLSARPFIEWIIDYNNHIKRLTCLDKNCIACWRIWSLMLSVNSNWLQVTEEGNCHLIPLL